jgi:hypothetical protein
MIITLEGLSKQSRKADCLVEAAEFFAEALLGKRMAKSITCDIEVRKKTDFKGECVNEDDTRRSRWFTISLRDENINEMIKTLAHEMVHVKQHVRNELGKKHVVLHKDGFVIQTEWQGQIWRPKKGEDAYYDSPWEIEAYGREVGLAYRFMKYWNGEANDS